MVEARSSSFVSSPTSSRLRLACAIAARAVRWSSGASSMAKVWLCSASILSSRVSAWAALSASAARARSCDTCPAFTCLLTASSLTPYFRAMPRYVLCRVANSSSIAKRCSCEQMVQTLPNYSSLSTPPPLLFCELGVPLCQDLGAKLGGLRLPLRLRLRLLRSARQGLSLRVQGFLELVFASLAHFQNFPTVQSWAVRPFARPAVFDEP